MENIALEFDQAKMIPYLELDNIQTHITTVEDLKQQYPKQFDVIGNFEGEYHMKTDPAIPPAKHAMRKTPIEYQEKISKQLDSLEQQEVIIKVTEPTEWVNSMTYPVKPDGDLCICIDRAAQLGLTLNSKKCHIKQKSVSFFRVTFGEDGMSPDPKKI